MNKKAQGISINTIIIAAIALAVLVVLFAIFTGRLGGFSKGVSETDTCRSKCESLSTTVGTQPSVPVTAGSNPCVNDERYIAGTYSDGKNGCCCK